MLSTPLRGLYKLMKSSNLNQVRRTNLVLNINSTLIFHIIINNLLKYDHYSNSEPEDESHGIYKEPLSYKILKSRIKTRMYGRMPKPLLQKYQKNLEARNQENDYRYSEGT